MKVQNLKTESLDQFQQQIKTNPTLLSGDSIKWQKSILKKKIQTTIKISISPILDKLILNDLKLKQVKNNTVLKNQDLILIF